MQAKAYSEVQDSSLAVSVVGDMGEAKSLQGSQQDNSGKMLQVILESLHSDIHVQRRRAGTQMVKEEKRNKGYAQFVLLLQYYSMY